MQLDDFKQTWREEMQKNEIVGNVNTAQVINDVNKIQMQSVIGVVASVVVTIGVVFWFYSVRLSADMGAFQLFNMLSIVVWLAFGTFLYFQARKTDIDDNWTLSARLSKEIEFVKKQKKLARDIPLKLLAPMLVWILVIIGVSYGARTGYSIPSISALFVIFGAVVFLVAAIWLLLRASKSKHEKILHQLVQLKTQLEVTN